MTSASFVVILPAIDPDLTRTCVASMHPQLTDRLVVVDNTDDASCRFVMDLAPCLQYVTFHRNTGVSAAWNYGIRAVRANRAAYLIIVSQSITFGMPGGTDFLAELDDRRPPVLMHSQHGWKLLAIAATMFDQVGMFDPAFPHYRNEVDWLYRCHLAGLPSPQYNDGRFDQVVCDAESAGDAQALARGRVNINFNESTAAWFAKWGGEKLEEQYTSPYNDDRLDHTWTGPPPVRVPAAIQ